MRGNRPEDEARSGPGDPLCKGRRVSAKDSRKAGGGAVKPFPLSLLTNHADFS